LVEVTDNLEARLTAHLSNTRFEDLPANVVDATKKCILDILGVMCGGSAADGIQPLIEMLQGWSLKPDATVVHGTRLASIHATWVNGAMAREFDDSHDPTGDHISVPIMPSALGAIELLGEVPGRELIVAYALGADLNARLRMASQQRSGENSFAANTYAPFSAGTVAAKLFGLTGMAMYNTLAWAYTQCAGGLQLQQSGQSALHIHHGLAASTGLQAALLAKQGFPGPDECLTGRFGFFAAYCGGSLDEAQVTDELGQRFEVANISSKQFPGGRVTHGPVEAAVLLHQQDGVRAEDIEQVTVLYGPRGFRMTCEPESQRRIPTTPQHAKFSLYYVVASALARGHVGIEDFTPEAVADPLVRGVAGKINVDIDPAQRGMPPGIVTVTLKDGRQVRREVHAFKGTPERPCTWEEYAAKFRRCLSFAAKPIAPDNVEAAIDFVANLESAGDVRRLVELLT
jgi:2-methylcitrate dehydratase PrpD